MISATDPNHLDKSDVTPTMKQIKEGLVAAGLQASVDSLPEELNFIRLINCPGMDDSSSIGVGRMRLDLVEFELRHLKEHVDKLKFNFLEMCTKQQFMTRLLDSDEWSHLYNNAIWTPADIKSLERQGEPAKATLVEAKAKTAALESELSRITEHLCTLNDIVGQKVGSAVELEAEIESLGEEIARLRPETEKTQSSSTPMRTVEELSTLLDDQIIGLEKRRTAIETRKASIAALSSQLATQQSEISTFTRLDTELAARLAEKDASERDQQQLQHNKQLASLAEWYKAVLQLHSSVSGVHRVELVRPDYLLVTLASEPSSNPNYTASTLLPVHLTVCPATGKLQAAQIGSTSSTPRRGQWRDVIETAVDTSNIGHLVRQIHAALAKS